MSWSDTLKGIVGESEQAAMPGLVEKILGPERIQSILAKLNDAGFQTQVQSWLDKNKDSLPITADQVRKALGDEHVQQIAKTLGIPMDKVFELLAKYLPQAAIAAPMPPPANPEPLRRLLHSL
jgi:uncharacterized protein YidB (DUF937 family)